VGVAELVGELMDAVGVEALADGRGRLGGEEAACMASQFISCLPTR
jgi:hypothetical protein